MAFWNGTEWIRDRTSRPVMPRPRTKSDWLATAAALLMIVVFMVPLTSTDATDQVVTLFPASGSAGAAFEASGSGFPAGSRVTATFDGKRLNIGNVRTSTSGTFSLVSSVPVVTPGSYAVTISASAAKLGGRQARAASSAVATFTVTGTAATPSPTAAPTPVATPTASPTPKPTATASPTPKPTAQPTQVSTPLPTPKATPVPGGNAPHILFGQGVEAPGVLTGRLYRDAPINLLSSWYNGPNDLSWMTGWEDDLVPQAYARGEALHLIVYSGDATTSVNTGYGPACGKPYPVSNRLVGDMQQLAHTFRPRAQGDRLYVTLFTEFQTYPCKHNTWVGSENYYRALKDNYRAAMTAFHAVGAHVSIGWGGWQARWDDPVSGAGRSLVTKFADVLGASDFQSFQAMQSDTNVSDVLAMTQVLGAYGPVMVAHYGPDNRDPATTNADLRAMLTDSYLSQAKSLGLFAFSFMHDGIWDGNDNLYLFTRDAVRRYGAN